MRVLALAITVFAFVFTPVAQAEKAITPANDVYNPACNGYLSTAFKWTAPKCKGLKKAKLTACLCSVDPFVETTVGCIDVATSGEKDEARMKLLRAAAYKSLIKTCKKEGLTLDVVKEYHANTTDLKPYPGSTAPFGKWKATKAFLVSKKDADQVVKAYNYNQDANPRAARFGGYTLVYWAGVLLIRAIIHWTNVLFPRSRHAVDNKFFRAVRSQITMPALVGTAHSRAPRLFRFFTLNIPTREQFLLIVGFLGVNVGCIFGLRLVNPNFKYNNNWGLNFRTHLGKRASYISLMQLPVMMLFAGRNNFLQWLTGWSQDTFVVFHKWVARIIFSNLLIHMICWSIQRSVQGRYGEMWSTPYWNWGVVAFTFLMVCTVMSVHAFRRLSYEFFLLLHWIGAIFFLVGAYWHVLKVGNEDLKYFYAAWAVWAFERAVRVVRIFIANPLAKAHVSHADDVIELSIDYSKFWKIRAGHYAFIHVLQPLFFWESHPFSLTVGIKEGEQKQIKLFCRVKDGMTKRTLKKAISAGGSFDTYVWIDGPYGYSHNLCKFQNRVFLAGGIGITAPFSYIQQILNENSAPGERLTLFWAIADESPLTWFAEQLEFMAKHNVNVNVYIGGSPTEVEPSLASASRVPAGVIQDNNSGISQSRAGSSEGDYPNEKKADPLTFTTDMGVAGSIKHFYGRLDTTAVVRSSIEKTDGSMSVLCCGPGSMNDQCRAAVAKELVHVQHYVEYFEESFSW